MTTGETTVAESQHDVWSQRLRELDRVGGLGLSALILFGLYKLATAQLGTYNSTLGVVAESQRTVASTQVQMLTTQRELVDLFRQANTAQTRIAEAVTRPCPP